MAEMGFYQDLMEQVKNQFSEEELSGLTFSLQTVYKQNNQEMHGITIKPDYSDAAPCFYVNESKHRFEMGESMDVLAAEIKRAYVDNLSLMMPSKITEMDLRNYDAVKDQFTLRLLEIRRNENFLQDKPYLDVGNGLAMVCDIRMRQEGGDFYSAAVNDQLLQAFGCSREELFQQAMSTAWIINTPKFYNMREKIGIGFFGEEAENLLEDPRPLAPEDKEEIYVLTNYEVTMGAAALYAPMVQKRIAEILDEGYYVLPSSIHEVLIVPESAGMNVQSLCTMVRDANQSLLAERDILSDFVYHYDRETETLQTVVSTEQPFLLSLADLTYADDRIENKSDYEQTLKDVVWGKMEYAMESMHRDGNVQVPFGKIASIVERQMEDDPKLNESLAYCLTASPSLQAKIEAGQLVRTDPEGIGELRKIFRNEIGFPKDLEAMHGKEKLRDRGEEIA